MIRVNITNYYNNYENVYKDHIKKRKIVLNQKMFT
jgi:hypothetical protein